MFVDFVQHSDTDMDLQAVYYSDTGRDVEVVKLRDNDMILYFV